jgi:glycosyltransferase involved in cell wall biosynthesis
VHNSNNCPCVTVLIPARNAEAFIAESMLSTVGQSHLAQVLVVINDSSDSTEQIVINYAEEFKTISYIKIPAAGIAGALNAGINQIKTEYIARLDADDVMVEGRLQKQVSFLKSNPRVAVVGSQLQFISSLGDKIGSSKYPIKARTVKFYLSFGNPLAHPSVLMRTSALPDSPYKPEFEGVEDLALWLELAKEYDLVNLDDQLTMYRQHDKQVSRSIKLKYQEIRLRSSGNLFSNTNPILKMTYLILNELKILWVSKRITNQQAK